MKLLSKSKSLLATLALAALAGGVHADVVSVTGYASGGVNYTSTAVAENGDREDNVGALRVTDLATNASFLAFCFEFVQGLDRLGQYDYTSGAYAASANVQELYDRYYGSVLQSQATAVGFQLALWDLSGQADIDRFVLEVDAIAKGKEMVDGVLNSTSAYTPDQYQFTLWANPDHQDLLQATPTDPNVVPEPQTHALLLGGLGLMAMGMAARRRKGGGTDRAA